MKPIFVRSLLLIVFLISFSNPSTASDFKRHVLGLYSSSDSHTLEYNPLRYNVEFVLNHLGLKLEYHDVSKGLPSEQKMKKYRGVVTWYGSTSMKDAHKYWIWIKKQIQAGRKIVMMGGTGALVDLESNTSIPLSHINQTLNLLGLEIGDQVSSLPMEIEITKRVPEMVEFERKLDYELDWFYQMESIGAKNEVFLKTRRRSTGAIADDVVLMPGGGFVNVLRAIYVDEDIDRTQWRVNPFRLFTKALDVEHTPRLDWTTLNGSRIYYSHIDGDGLSSRIIQSKKEICAEKIYEDVLKTYSQLPFTVSVIIADIDRKTQGNKRSEEIAQKIFRLPNVEPASHTYAHPLIWDSSIAGAAADETYENEIKTIGFTNDALLAYKIPGYEYSPEKETLYSVRYINENLLPKGKKCEMLFWSGNCMPDEITLAMVASGKILNLNGGDSRFDDDYQSYAYIAPLYRKVGRYYQIHASNGNENIYTDDWSARFGGYQSVIQTFERTESPRRVAPIDIYYHFYSAEYEASLFAVQKAYEWSLAQTIFPIYASRYSRVAEGFISGKIENLGQDKWKILDNGECRTIRFDSTILIPDMKKSQGVTGYNHYQGSLYIHLDESQKHLIQLTGNTSRSFSLKQAQTDVNRLSGSEKEFRFETSSCHSAAFMWRNVLSDRDYRIRVISDGKVQDQFSKSNSAGELNFNVTVPAVAEVIVTAQNL